MLGYPTTNNNYNPVAPEGRVSDKPKPRRTLAHSESEVGLLWKELPPTVFQWIISLCFTSFECRQLMGSQIMPGLCPHSLPFCYCFSDPKPHPTSTMQCKASQPSCTKNLRIKQKSYKIFKKNLTPTLEESLRLPRPQAQALMNVLMRPQRPQEKEKACCWRGVGQGMEAKLHLTANVSYPFTLEHCVLKTLPSLFSSECLLYFLV